MEKPRGPRKKRDRRTHITGTPPARYCPEVLEKFLDTMRLGWSVTRAARAANVDRKTVYRWREEQPEFAEAWEDALAEGGETLEDAATERAVEGVSEPVFNKDGDTVGHRVKYSDTLLMHQLEARMPDKYRKNLNVSGTLPASQTNILIVGDGEKD